ncbi:MAG: ABC transporter permease [Bacteroidales bacterium]|nr:ABC transporter permease [Bacteroidales bacterium]
MRSFIGLLRKEFYHILRDKRTMLILFGMPIAQMLLFGFVITNEIKNVKIGILDKSRDNTTMELTSKILSSGYFQLYAYLDNDNQIEELFKKGKVNDVIVFEKGFERQLKREGSANIQLVLDATDANLAQVISNYTSSIFLDYIANQNAMATMPLQIDMKTRLLYNEELKGVYMFVPGIMAMILMLISALMTSISIVREKEHGSMEVLLVSPLKPIQIIIGKVTPYILLSFINAIIIILLGFFVFNMPVKGSLVLLLAESILFITLALSLGILISTLTQSQQTAMFISMFALMLPTILLSGFIFPVNNMPGILQWLCHIIPPKYFITIIKNIMIKGTGLQYVWKETLVLLGMTGLFIALSVKKFKIRLD